MQANTFDVIERRKRIMFFKLGKLWVFKQFFDNRALFDALMNYYNKDLFRFEFKSTGARNNALKLLERNGFDYDLVEDLKGYVVELPREICTDPEELRGLQGDCKRADIPDEGPGRCQGSCGPGCKNCRRRVCLLIKLLLYPLASGWPAYSWQPHCFSVLHSAL